MQCVTSSFKRVILDYSSYRITEFSCCFFVVSRWNFARGLSPTQINSSLSSYSLHLCPPFSHLLFRFFHSMDCQTALIKQSLVTRLSWVVSRKKRRHESSLSIDVSLRLRVKKYPAVFIFLHALDDLERENKLAWEGMGESHNRNLHIISDLLPTILLFIEFCSVVCCMKSAVTLVETS